MSEIPLPHEGPPRFISTGRAWQMVGADTREQFRAWVKAGKVGPQFIQMDGGHRVYPFSEFTAWLADAVNRGKFLNAEEWAKHRTTLDNSPTGTGTKPRRSRRRKSVPASQFDSAKGC